MAAVETIGSQSVGSFLVSFECQNSFIVQAICYIHDLLGLLVMVYRVALSRHSHFVRYILGPTHSGLFLHFTILH